MSMISDEINALLTDDDQFFDFGYITGNVCITDYCRLNKELVLSRFEGSECDLVLGKKRKRMGVDSIDELKNIFKQLISKVIVMSCKNSVFEYTVSQINYTDGKIYIKYPDNNFSKIDKELLANQLIFDVLFDKYRVKCTEKMMTRAGYAKYMSSMLCQNGYSLYDVINKSMERSSEKYYHFLKYSKIGEQLELLGADRDIYAEYYNPQISRNLTKKKPKYIWDILYYNHNLNLTYRQYRRQVTKKNRNYSYEEFVKDLKEYNDFVNKLLPVDNELPEKYFVKSMEYYVLESYKRIDFIFKLINIMHKMVTNEISKEHFLVKRFHPPVLIPYEKDNDLDFDYRCKYYRPLFLIEDLIQQNMQNNNLSYVICEDLLSRYQYIRAKVYELFKYQYEYISSDYNEIKKFIDQFYNLKSYHESNIIWEIIEDKEWKDMDGDMKRQIKKLMHNFIIVNDSLFWESPDRKIDIPKNT